MRHVEWSRGFEPPPLTPCLLSPFSLSSAPPPPTQKKKPTLSSQLQQARISSAAPVLSNGAPPADLQARCSELQAQLDAARANAATSAAAAAKYERDLQDLAGAYAGLEAHAQDLESRVASLGSSSGGAGEIQISGVREAVCASLTRKNAKKRQRSAIFTSI